MSVKKSPALIAQGFFISLILFLNIFVAFPAKAAYQTSGLIADWRGSTLVNASTAWSDSINSSTLDQSSTTYSSANGGFVTLNGSSSFLHATNNLTTFNTSNMSMFFWIKPTSNAGVIMQLGRSGSDADSELVLSINGSGNLSFWDYNGGLGFNNVTSSGTVTLNQWNYVGFTKSTSAGTSTFTYYINGNSSGSHGPATDRSISLNDFTLGKDYRDNNGFYNGSYARVSIWNTALTSTDVTNNYAASNGIATAPSITTANNTQSVNAGSAITTAATTNTGGAVSTYSISPALPSGVSMDANGNISGTPTSVQAQTTYTITATNPAGTSTSTFRLTVLINSTSATFTNISLANYRQPTNLVVTVTGTSGRVTFKHNGKNIVGCIKVPTVSASTITATCSWKPSVKKYVSLTATFAPTSAAFASSTTPAMRTLVIARTTPR
jgi:hypothetical protein